jgi:hypothetical protein
VLVVLIQLYTPESSFSTVRRHFDPLSGRLERADPV